MKADSLFILFTGVNEEHFSTVLTTPWRAPCRMFEKKGGGRGF